MKMDCKQGCLPGWSHFKTTDSGCCSSFWSCFGNKKWCEYIDWVDTEYVLPDMAPPPSPFPVELCADSTILRQSQKDILAQKGFTKCCMSGFLGLVVAGTRNYPDSYLQWASNTAAGILDQDNDGVIDDQAANEINVKLTGNPPLMVGGYDEDEEKKGDEIADDDQSNFDYAFSLQTWKTADADDVKKVITEEVFHMVSTYVYAKAYPDQFGTDNWSSSVLMRECSAQMCVNWMHPENQCPTMGVHANPPLQGTCNDPGCDCVEWFHQIALLLVGQEPGWRSPLLPSVKFHSKESIRVILSKGFLDMMDDPKYHQLKSRISWSDSSNCEGYLSYDDLPADWCNQMDYWGICGIGNGKIRGNGYGCKFTRGEKGHCKTMNSENTCNAFQRKDSCGCGEGKFCNFDDDAETRGCEDCSDFSTRNSCYDDGLPSRGAEDCVTKCFSYKNFATAESVISNPAELSILHGFALIGLIFILYSSSKNCRKHSDYVDVSEKVEQEEI